MHPVRRPAGFDYGFRPTSYFEDLDPTTIVVASILGEERRKDVQARIASSDFDPFVWGEWLTESKLEDDIRGREEGDNPLLHVVPVLYGLLREAPGKWSNPSLDNGGNVSVRPNLKRKASCLQDWPSHDD